MNVQERLLRETIDPHLSTAYLSGLATRALGVELRVESVRVLSGGCWNRVIGVSFSNQEQDLVFKISPRIGDKRIGREYLVLQTFIDQTEMPVPEPLLFDDSGSPIPGSILVMRMLPGRVMHQLYGVLTPPMQEAITNQIADHVIALHNRRSSGFGGLERPEDERSGWPEFWLPRFDGVFDEISRSDLLSARFLQRVMAVRRRFPELLDIGTESTFTHYDIWSGNVMIDFQGSRPVVSGFIDIPGFWADYARELSFMEMFGLADARFYTRYWDSCRKDPGFDLRKNIYNLKMHLKHISMYPGEQYYRQGAEAALSFIEEN